MYPAALCQAILKGVAEQRLREGEVLPPRVFKKLAEGRTIYCLQEERPEFRELAAVAQGCGGRYSDGSNAMTKQQLYTIVPVTFFR